MRLTCLVHGHWFVDYGGYVVPYVPLDCEVTSERTRTFAKRRCIRQGCGREETEEVTCR